MMTKHRVRRTALLGTAVALVGVGGIVAPAAAAPTPGLAQAVAGAATFSFDFTLDGEEYSYAEATALGAVTNADGPARQTGTDTPLVGPEWAQIALGEYVSEAATDAGRITAARADVQDTTFELFGFEVLRVDQFLAESAAAVVGAPAANAEINGIHLFGEDVTDDLADGAVYNEQEIPLDDAPDGFPAGVIVQVSLAHGTQVDASSASALGLEAQISLEAVFGDDSVVSVESVASLTFAASQAFAPAVQPVTATVAPASGPTTGGQLVTLTGTGFSADTIVSIDGEPIETLSASPTEITFRSPAHAAGETVVFVDNPGDSAEPIYTYVAPAITGVTPASGPAAGGTEVTIAGGALDTVASVWFGDAEAGDVRVAEDGSSVTAVAPAGTGVAEVSLVLATGETIVAPEVFTYIAGGGGGGGGVTPTGGGSGTLPRTGADDARVPALVAGGLLVAGLGAVLVAHRGRGRRA